MKLSGPFGLKCDVSMRIILIRIASCVLLSFAVGSIVAFFLWALDRVTSIHWQNGWLLFVLPLGGLFAGWLDQKYGQGCEGGNSQIYARVQQCIRYGNAAAGSKSDSGEVFVPWRMAPLALFGTLLTHLFGGSAGREGTAIQIGGSLANTIASWVKLNRFETGLNPGGISYKEARGTNYDNWTATFVQAGIAAGFGSVFGTPLAATLFAVEVVGRGVARFASLPICLACAITADHVTQLWGIKHPQYAIDYTSLGLWDLSRISKVFVAAMAFGLAAWIFIQLTKYMGGFSKRLFVKRLWLRPMLGGLIVAAVASLMSWQQYLGLGVTASPFKPDSVSIVSSFTPEGADGLSWLWKTLLTATTVGFGFKGGEATPLFFVGSTLGNTAAEWLSLPYDLSAGLGFVAVFAAATRTPLACSVMAVELFAQHSSLPIGMCALAYALIACLTAHWTASQLERAGRWITARFHSSP
jgi:H+/Cl- antiporter ClcA